MASFQSRNQPTISSDESIFAGLGDRERTFEALDHMIVLGPVKVGRILSFPELDLIRGDPRLKARLLDYNEDDCRAMRVVLDAIKALPVRGEGT